MKTEPAIGSGLKTKPNWWLYAVSGLILNGLGLSLLGEAILRKSTGEGWVLTGTLALACCNAGICLVVEAAKKNRSEP